MLSRTPPTEKTTRPLAPPIRAAAWAAVAFGVVAAATFGAGGCASTGASAAVRNAEGVNFYAAGDYDRAIAVFQESIEMNPRSAEAYYNLGAAYQRKGVALGDVNLLTQAENAYWAALELDAAPETIVCCYRGIATSATTRGDVDGALQTLQDWSERNPESIEPKLEIAYFLEAQDRDDDAYSILQEVAEAAPNDYRAFYKMGVLQERAGNVEEALNQTAIAGRLNPTDESVAKRTTELRTQLAAVKRGGSLESADAAPGETKLVSSTSAQATETAPNADAEQEASGESSAPSDPPETPELPESLDAPAATNVPTKTLGKDEVVLFANPNGSDDRTTKKSVAKSDDSVRWVSATSASSVATIRDGGVGGDAENGPLPDGTGSSSGVAFVAQNAESTSGTSAASETSEKTAQAEPQKTPQAVQIAPSSAAAPAQKTKKRTELNSGPPAVRAGTLF